MSFPSRPCLSTLLLLALSVCALLSIVSAVDTCTFTLYQDNACAGKPVSDTITLSGLTTWSQCVPSADGVTSQAIAHNPGTYPYWNISYAYFQVQQATTHTRTLSTASHGQTNRQTDTHTDKLEHQCRAQ